MEEHRQSEQEAHAADLAQRKERSKRAREEKESLAEKAREEKAKKKKHKKNTEEAPPQLTIINHKKVAHSVPAFSLTPKKHQYRQRIRSPRRRHRKSLSLEQVVMN